MRVVLAVDASPDSKNAAQVIRHMSEPPVLDVLNVVDEDALKHAYISPTMPADYLETYRREVVEVAEQVLHEMKTDLEPHCRHIRSTIPDLTLEGIRFVGERMLAGSRTRRKRS